MDEVQDVVAAIVRQLEEADTALHNGDAEPRKVLWSHNDPVTVFGAVVSRIGWNEIDPAFDWVASNFSNCQSFEYEVLAAGVSGDLAYIAGIEHTTASVGGAAPAPYSLRVTTVLRREDGEWRVVHRHADPVPGDDPGSAQVNRLKESRDGP